MFESRVLNARRRKRDENGKFTNHKNLSTTNNQVLTKPLFKER